MKMVAKMVLGVAIVSGQVLTASEIKLTGCVDGQFNVDLNRVKGKKFCEFTIPWSSVGALKNNSAKQVHDLEEVVVDSHATAAAFVKDHFKKIEEDKAQKRAKDAADSKEQETLRVAMASVFRQITARRVFNETISPQGAERLEAMTGLNSVSYSLSEQECLELKEQRENKEFTKVTRRKNRKQSSGKTN